MSRPLSTMLWMYVTVSIVLLTAYVSSQDYGRQCRERGEPAHGRARVVLARPSGIAVQYSCLPGYRRVGNLLSFCVRGVWTSPLPACIGTTSNNQLSGEEHDGVRQDQDILVSHEELPSTHRPVARRRVLTSKQERKKRKKRKRKGRGKDHLVIQGSDTTANLNLDMSCLLNNQNNTPKFVRPPQVPNSLGPKFVKRKTEKLKYFVAKYRCRPGFKLHNPQIRSLGCQTGKWIGTLPICLPRRKKIGCINAGCEHDCREINGKPKCYCFKGFIQQGKSCVDINECSAGNGGCKGSCHNTPSFFYCGCAPGYRLASDRRSCVDVNECVSRNGHGPCQGHCHNIDGSYQCSCESVPGTQLAADGISCEDIDECSDHAHLLGCSHGCVNTVGSAFCLCPSGYQLGPDWRICQDIDECAGSPCNSSCVNTPGSYHCSDDVDCSTGYHGSHGKCKDIDECASLMINCSHSCINTQGSYICSCPLGFVLHKNGATCIDTDECLEFTESSLCSHNCLNTIGSYKCLCPPDHELSTDHRTCHPKEDPCQSKNCSQDCIIENELATCVCDSGYILEEGSQCVDVDECTGGTSGCSHNCINVEGFFICTCPIGMTLISDKKTCIEKDLHNFQNGCNNNSTDFCSCPDGYQIINFKCEDINECYTSPNPCSQLCINNIGSYQCLCKEGFELSEDNNTCIDIDECTENNVCPGKQCINTEGGYLCQCGPGYTMINDTLDCEDIDECSLIVDENSMVCSHTCVNSIGSFHCECPVGFILGKDTRTCEDIDECFENNEITTRCSHDCINHVGSYRCDCPEGFILKEDNHFCHLLNGCEINNGGCTHICNDDDGKPFCDCPEKFQIANDGVTCVKRWCSENNGGCGQLCNDTSGQCSCFKGFTLHNDSKECIDLNECANNNGGCSQKCFNTEGSFYCTCASGYHKFDSKNDKCVDINECAQNESVCEQVCENTKGSYECKCFTGFELTEDEYCVDINECLKEKVCDHSCTNTEGSFKCECREGFTLSPDQTSCKDIDECYLNISSCNQLCKNTAGGFYCECEPGFKLINKTFCISKNLKEVYTEEAYEHHTSINLGQATKSGCVSFLSEEKSVEVDCGSQSRWYPEGTVCFVSCKTGYTLEGSHLRVCQLDGSWSGVNVFCRAQTPPFIRCPPEIRLNLPIGEHSTTVHIPRPKTNVDWEKFVMAEPAWGKKLFTTLPCGSTTVQFTVQSDTTERIARCNVSIHIIDAEKPTITRCPDDMSVIKQSTHPMMEVNWEEPVIADNVNIAYVFQTKKPGAAFGEGFHLITYVVADSSGNIATCQFSITVISKKFIN